MKNLLELLGNAAAVLGVLACLVAGLVRALGIYAIVGGFDAMTLFIGGMGFMVAACLVKIHLLGLGR